MEVESGSSTQSMREALTDIPSLSNSCTITEFRLSPIHRLSPELLSYIFVLCLSVDRLPKPCVKEAPLLCGRICKHWREVATSTPQLWAGIEITIGFNKFFDADALDYWLGKSGALPLSICLRNRRDLGTQVDDVMFAKISALLKSMVRYVDRWRDFTLEGCSGGYLFPGLDLIMMSLSNSRLYSLEKLHIYFPSRSFVRSAMLDLTLFPSLTDLCIDVGCGDQSFSPGEWSLCALQRLKLPLGMSLNSILQILRHSPSLQYLEFGIYNWDPVTSKDELIILPYLSELSVLFGRDHVQRRRDLHPFFSRLHLPNLKIVRFNMGGCQSEEEQPDWSAFESLLRHSRPPLYSFSIFNGSRKPVESIVSCLKYTPELRYFELSTWDDEATPLFRALANRRESGCSHQLITGSNTFLCPFLTVLKVDTYVNNPGVFEDAFLEMLQSRLSMYDAEPSLMPAPLCCTLQKINLFVFNGGGYLTFRSKDLEVLDGYRASGLNLNYN